MLQHFGCNQLLRMLTWTVLGVADNNTEFGLVLTIHSRLRVCDIVRWQLT